MVTSLAPQKRAALLTTTSSTCSSLLGEARIIRKTSAVAVCRSKASARCFLALASSSCRSATEAVRRAAAGALLRFGLVGLRCCVFEVPAYCATPCHVALPVADGFNLSHRRGCCAARQNRPPMPGSGQSTKSLRNSPLRGRSNREQRRELLSHNQLCQRNCCGLRAEPCEITTLTRAGPRKLIASSRAPRRSFGSSTKKPLPPKASMTLS